MDDGLVFIFSSWTVIGESRSLGVPSQAVEGVDIDTLSLGGWCE